jgi:ribosomal protein S18 acetylase RimI-like enzyme
MTQKYKVIVEASPVPTEMAVVIKGLTAYNASKTDGDAPNYLFITVRDDAGSVVGGLVGATYLGWLQVQAVWVSDELRGLGYGSELMQAAEDAAVERGVPRVFLETLSFQALPFYEKRGYKVVSKIPDFPPGGCRYALTKDL